MKPDLTYTEIQLLRVILHSSGTKMSGPEREIALSAYRKLTDTAEAMTCSHCKAGPSRRRNGLCDACNSYGQKYGHLPPERVLVKRGNP